jgi:hypothetical protein
MGEHGGWGGVTGAVLCGAEQEDSDERFK